MPRERGRRRDDCVACQADVPAGSCARQSVVYSMKCELCGEEYVVETSRALRLRFGEPHIDNHASRESMLRSQPDARMARNPVLRVRNVLAQTRIETERKVREAIETRKIESSIT